MSNKINFWTNFWTKIANWFRPTKQVVVRYRILREPSVDCTFSTKEKSPKNEGWSDEEYKLSEDQSTDALLSRLDSLGEQLDNDSRKLQAIHAWFEEFADLAEWMREQGMWDAEDIDIEHPMQTYKKGLTRFCKTHNISINK